jgi:hypothetical protein
MLKQLVTATLLLLCFAPAALAEVVSGKIQSVDAENSRVSVQTADGKTQVYRYLPGTLEAAKLSEGSDVRLNQLDGKVGRVVAKMRNYVRVRPDNAEDDRGEFYAMTVAPHSFEVGDRVVILSRCKVIAAEDEVVGYLIPGEIVPQVRLASLEFSEPQPLVIQPAPRDTSQPAVVESAPEAVVEPVRALW